MTISASGEEGLRLWPLLWVGDLERSISFWAGTLGFTLVGADGDPGCRQWCRLERAGASVMLQQRCRVTAATGGDAPTETEGDAAVEPEGTALYFVCGDVDAIHEELSARGLDLEPPETAEYGMRQLRIPEPDGHRVWFESPVPVPGDA